MLTVDTENVLTKRDGDDDGDGDDDDALSLQADILVDESYINPSATPLDDHTLAGLMEVRVSHHHRFPGSQ